MTGSSKQGGPMGGTAVVWAGVLAGLVSGGLAPRQILWQADLQVRGLAVTASKGGLLARVIVAAEFGDALAVRLEFLLPVGVGLVELSAGCAAGPNPPGVSALRGLVVCTLGTLPARTSRELHVATTSPPAGVARAFGVVALSDTPDPRPGNNFAEKTLP